MLVSGFNSMFNGSTEPLFFFFVQPLWACFIHLSRLRKEQLGMRVFFSLEYAIIWISDNQIRKSKDLTLSLFALVAMKNWLFKVKKKKKKPGGETFIPIT